MILKPYGEIVSKPFDISHVEKDLGELAAMLLRFDDEVKVVMEATGIYHLPVLTYLQEKGLFVAVINPYLMKVYRSGDLRKAKTDKIDSRIIANYGIEHWFTMAEFKASDDVYGELKMLYGLSVLRRPEGKDECQLCQERVAVQLLRRTWGDAEPVCQGQQYHQFRSLPGNL